MDNVLGAIGNTPLVRLNKIPQEENLECEIGKLLLLKSLFIVFKE